MNDEALIDQFSHPGIPTSFRVIGVGETAKEIIETVKSYGYDSVSASVVTHPFECIPTDEDKIAIIVAYDDEAPANGIAKTFRDAGVLTLGLLDNADQDCYDSVVCEASSTEYAGIIKSILRPLVGSGIICYGYNDLKTTLTVTTHFLVKSESSCGTQRVREALDSIMRALSPSLLGAIESISILLYFNRDSSRPLVTQEVSEINDFICELPESVEVTWAVYPDKNLNDNEVKVSIIAAVK